VADSDHTNVFAMIHLLKTVVVLLAIAATARAQIAKPVARAVNSPGATSATPSGASTAPVVSGDGRYVAFSSSAKDLVLGQSNTLCLDVFLRDIDNGATIPISVATNAILAGTNNSACPMISADGRFIAFISAVSNLTAQRTNSYPQLLVRDAISNITETASVSSSGVPVSGGIGDFDMTADGRYLVFVASSQVFLRDRQTHTTGLITFKATSPTTQSTGRADMVSISTNGQRVVYLGTASDLIVWPGSPPTTPQPYLFDAVANSNMCPSLDAQQVLGGMPQAASSVVISADGSTVAFGCVKSAYCLIYEPLATRVPQLIASNFYVSYVPELSSDGTQLLYGAPSNGTANVYLWNSQTALTQTINVTTDGSVNGNSYPCGMSADGSRVVFVSNATNLTADVANGLYQIYVRDTVSATTRLVSVTANGPAPTSQRHSYPAISADGSRVIFTSADNSFVADDNNHNVDVFVWSWATGQVQLVSAKNPSQTSVSDVAGIVPSSFVVGSNGAYVGFAAVDGNLVSNDTNSLIDLFVRDTINGNTTLLTANPDGSLNTDWQSLRPPFSMALSADGRFLAYLQDIGKVYLRDFQAGTRTLVTATNTFLFSAANTAAISADGRFVTFDSSDISQSTAYNIFLYDSFAGTNIQITFPPAGSQYFSGYNSSNAVFSPDGKWIVYQSTPGYVTGVGTSTNGAQYYGWNIAGKTNTHVSYAPNHTVLPTGTSNAVFSADGQIMAFSSTQGGVPVIVTHNFSNASNQIVLSNATNPSINRDGTKIAYNVQLGSSNQIYVQTIGTTKSNLVSVGYNGVSLANSNCSAPILTADDRFVIFTSTATNLVANDTNGVMDIFVRDLVLSNTFAITGPGSSVPNFGAVNPVVSADGRTIVFQSFSTDFNTNIFTANRNLFTARIVVGDSDHDGMDDDWEMTYFGNLSHNGTADTDGDGLTDYQEFLAGTNPIDNGSVLRCLAVVTSGGGATVYWSAVPGHGYRIEYKNSVDDPTWKTLVSSTIANAQSASVVDSDASLLTQRFYRVIALP
jgi:Tol biopolymer transport system component